MAESQSRYGIIADLTGQKTKAKEELYAAEEIFEAEEVKYEATIKALKDEIDTRDSTYKRRFEDWKVQRELEKTMLEKAHTRAIEVITDEISEKSSTFEGDHRNWKATKEANIGTVKSGWVTTKRRLTTTVKTKQAIITELETGIKDLKSISSETKE